MSVPVVTGVGVISPLATDARAHFDAFIDGRSGVAESSEPEFAKYSPQLEARVKGFDRRGVIESRMLRKLLAPSAGFAVAAAGEAVADAGLADEPDLLAGAGLYVGSLSLEVDPEVFIAPLKAALDPSGEFDLSLFARRGMRLLDPLFLVKALPNAGLCGVSLQYQTLGSNTNLTNGATSGLSAVVLAAAAIERDEVDCALAGGYDSLLVMDAIAEHLIAGRVAHANGPPERSCRPFTRTRNGYALGEGAAFVMLEARERASRRGARAYGRVLGHASTTDPSALDTSAPVDGSALAHAARQALERAGIGPSELGAIFGDGLGTVADDLRESRAAAALLNGSAVPFTAATSALGYTGAASGTFSLVHALLALRRGVAPALANCDDPDPDCPIPHLSRTEPLAAARVMVWNSERGVKNVALVAAGGA
jgi:3-oxoacyl-(acyl-carrier-protein) synthase